MAVDILQRFLTKRLFDVGGDDKRVESLRQAAADVAALIKAAPQRAATLTMVAIDPTIGPDEPVVGEIMKILETRWQSYAGAFTDEKLPTVARAILLHGLGAAASSDAVAAAISLTARTMLPLLGEISDRDLWSEIVGDAERRLASRAEREWAMPSAAAAAQAELDLGVVEALAPPTMSHLWLSERLQWASAPNNPAGEAFKDANPELPDAGAEWAAQFAPRAASAIGGAVNSVIKTLAEKITERDGGESLRRAIKTYVSTAADGLTRTAIGLERRTSLLWWKEALYSPAAGLSYRDVAPAAAAALAALDASNQVGAFAPRMTEALVRETLRSIDPSGMMAERPLLEQVNSIVESGGHAGSAVQQGYAAIYSEPGRAPLGTVLARAEPIMADTLTTRLGIPAGQPLSVIDLGVWLYRDLQAAAATPPPAKPKRKGRGS